MKTKGFFSAGFNCLVLAGLLAACNLPGSPSTALPGNATQQDATLVPTTTSALRSNTPAVALPSPTAGSGSPTASATTPFFGPSITHIDRGKSIDISYIHMVSPKYGWAIGGPSQASDHVFQTGDGGVSWHDVTPPQPAPEAGGQLQALGFFQSWLSAWVIFTVQAPSQAPPYALIWYTTDGGQSWKYSILDTSTFQESFNPLYIDFADGLHGWMMAVLGAGMSHEYVGLFATQDGGATWKDILDPYGNNVNGDDIQSCDNKTGMVFVDARNGWLTRDCTGLIPLPHVFRTSDGGVSWTRIDLPAPTTNPSFYDTNVCGTFSPNAFSAQAVIVDLRCLDIDTFKIESDYAYSTSDGGKTWQTYTLPANYTIGQGLFFLDPQNGFALGRTIYTTTDGGKTWASMKKVNWDGQFSFTDANHAWAVARNEGQIALVTTSDGDATWHQVIPNNLGPLIP